MASPIANPTSGSGAEDAATRIAIILSGTDADGAIDHFTIATVPTDGRTHDPVLYMEDSAWPHEAMLDEYLEKARTHYAPSLEQQTERSLLTLLGVFQAALGAARRREVVLWQRVDFPERLPGLFTRELPAHVKGPGTWMHDALEVRDDWQSRLLRSANWSPLG